MWLKWGKSDGVNEQQNELLALITSLFSTGYKRFSMSDLSHIP